jgi:hypothetical protein
MNSQGGLTNNGRCAVVLGVIGADPLTRLPVSHQVVVSTWAQLIVPTFGFVGICAADEYFPRTHHAEDSDVILAVLLETREQGDKKE